jgi:large subunit ribosomal protein L22
MKAYLKNYRQSPRKVRLVADLIRGKTVPQALLLLRVTPKRATSQFEKVIKSAIANARQKGLTEEKDLIVKEVRVDKGITLHRVLPRAQGRATRYDKHSSNITLTLEESNKHENRNAKSETKSTKSHVSNKPKMKSKISKTVVAKKSS